MRRYNKILGFVAVSFVLVFLGKVSKASLFSAYFKTIAEVEVRNTQDLQESGMKLEMGNLSTVRKISRILSALGSLGLSSRNVLPPRPALVMVRIPLDFNYQYRPTHHFFVSSPIRAPGIS